MIFKAFPNGDYDLRGNRKVEVFSMTMISTYSTERFHFWMWVPGPEDHVLYGDSVENDFFFLMYKNPRKVIKKKNWDPGHFVAKSQKCESVLRALSSAPSWSGCRPPPAGLRVYPPLPSQFFQGCDCHS